MYIVHLIVLALITLFIIIRYDKISNLQFMLISSFLLFLLYLYRLPIRESFTIEGTLKQIQVSEYESKLLSLPTQVQDILMPKLIHLESAYKTDMNDKRKESHTLDENTYLSNKDPYVVDDGSETINKDKWAVMCQEYRDVDTVLKLVQSMNVDVWDKITEFDPNRTE